MIRWWSARNSWIRLVIVMSPARLPRCAPTPLDFVVSGFSHIRVSHTLIQIKPRTQIAAGHAGTCKEGRSGSAPLSR